MVYIYMFTGKWMGRKKPGNLAAVVVVVEEAEEVIQLLTGVENIWVLNQDLNSPCTLRFHFNDKL